MTNSRIPEGIFVMYTFAIFAKIGFFFGRGVWLATPGAAVAEQQRSTFRENIRNTTMKTRTDVMQVQKNMFYAIQTLQ